MNADVAALFVARHGCYWDDPTIDAWDEARDARLYAGPYPVVAHPPCTRWCRLAGLVQARWGYRVGDDGGCFAAALASVRRWAGVLEHPAYSKAWPAHGIASPPRAGGWVRADDVGGWTWHVEQGRYGHPAKKATWLYAHGTTLPTLRWGSTPDGASEAIVSWCGNRTETARYGKRRRLSSREASATPPAFREVLLAMARSVRGGAP